jgi:hypothetical protein
MAKYSKPSSSTPVTPAVIKQTPARGTPIPKSNPAPAPAPKKVITHEMIAKRAFEIHCSGTGGSEADNWYRAERELRGI